MQREVVVCEKKFDFGSVRDAVSFFIKLPAYAFFNGHHEFLLFIFSDNENSGIVFAHFASLNSIDFAPSGGRCDPIHFHRISIADQLYCFAGFRINADVHNIGSKRKNVHGKPHMFFGNIVHSPRFFQSLLQLFLSLFFAFSDLKKQVATEFCLRLLPEPFSLADVIGELGSF